jgi:hypothetical protein
LAVLRFFQRMHLELNSFRSQSLRIHLMNLTLSIRPKMPNASASNFARRNASAGLFVQIYNSWIPTHMWSVNAACLLNFILAVSFSVFFFIRFLAPILICNLPSLLYRYPRTAELSQRSSQ